MKKNLLRSFVLVLGLVTCFAGSSFASNNKSYDAVQTQVVQNNTCEFKGRYVLSKDSLKEIQKATAEAQEKIFNDMGIDFVDLKIRRIDLKINDNGTGKIRMSFDIKTKSDLGVNIYCKNNFVFDISQKDTNTFVLDCVTKSANNLDSTNSDIKVSKDVIYGREYLVLNSNDSESKLVFEKVR